MGGALTNMEGSGPLDTIESSGSSEESSFVDEEEADALTIDYDKLDMGHSSHGNDRGMGDSSYDNIRRKKEEEKPMMIDNTISTSNFRWKVFVVVLMCVNTAIVIGATSVYLNYEDEQEHERAFISAAKSASDVAHNHAKALTDSLEVLSDTITSFCRDTGAEWPYVTLPSWEERVAPIRETGMLDAASFLPVIEMSQRKEWEAYAVQKQGWLQISYRAQMISQLEKRAEGSKKEDAQHDIDHNASIAILTQDYSISQEVSMTVMGEHVVHPGEGPYAPIWQLSPPPLPSEAAVINTDLMAGPNFQVLFESLMKGDADSGIVISHALPLSLYTTDSAGDQDNSRPSPSKQSKSVLLHPIRTSYGKHGDIKGFAMGVFDWVKFFSDLLHEDITGLDCVLHNPCDDIHSQTFRIQGRQAILLDTSDLYEGKHSTSCYPTVLTEFTSHASCDDDQDQQQNTTCHYEIHFHPSPEFYSDVESNGNGPAIFTACIAAVSLGTGVVFLLYIYLIGNRQHKIMAVATSTAAIVSNLFPSNVRERIIKDAHDEVQLRMEEEKSERFRILQARRVDASPCKRYKKSANTSNNSAQSQSQTSSQATVLFADIVGFTAWSSVREPTQVFELLETIYHSFDEIARRRKVFKVETIGDCYVAVTGLPDPCRFHAVNMCRFARDCLHVMEILVKKLEVSLGPDTGELSMRFGLHSGPVTAGVLRGERSRFQLFGDTVNTAARMESNGAREKIHISEQTAENLRKAGKEDWFVPREEKIIAKGKGELQTFWLHTKKTCPMMIDESSRRGSLTESADDWCDLPSELFDSQRSKMGLGTNEIRQCLSEQNQRLADWNSTQLLLLLSNVVARRIAARGASGTSDIQSDEAGKETHLGNAHIGVGDTGDIVAEATDMIVMPNYDAEVFVKVEHSPANLSEVVQQQLHDYVSIICSMYVDNPFHSYQHASHVTMSIIKLLTSIAAPQENNFNLNRKEERTARTIKREGLRFHSKTYGISSDPIAHFALAFAALIHDVDHPGVTNKQLVKEKSRLARIFNNRCVVEQNSFQCAWDLLMDPSFDQLRQAIYTTKEELHHFRQLVVNAVVATDLLDKGLNEERKKRWDLAFPRESNQEAAPPEASTFSQKALQDRQATVVLEYLVQASDVAHTMQHWSVFRKWNERLFCENMKAYNSGRLDENPCDFWYEAELEFFDNAIIPMAQRLKDCGAFGVYFEESLSYATQNRQEWQRRGKDIVVEMEKAFEGLVGMGFSARRDSTEDD